MSAHQPSAASSRTKDRDVEGQNMPSQEGGAPTSSEDTLTRHHHLMDWVVQHGGYLHPDVVITHDSGKGYHAQVAPGKTITANTRIASCPIETTLCVLNPLDIAPFSCHGVRFPHSFLEMFGTTPDILHTFFLMEQYLLGDKSWWARYISTLPSPADVKAMHFESEDDMFWIRGTNFEGAVDLQTSKWQNHYFTGLEQLEEADWPNAKNETLSWDLFRWAATMFGTRSFTSQVLSDTKPADLARPLGREDPNHTTLAKLFSERFAVLLPALDILNHRPGAQIEWQARHGHVGLEVLETYESGQEIYNNYGPRDNESLLLSYGFVIENNIFDHTVVSIKVPQYSPLADARTWPVDSRSNEHYNCYIFGPEHPIITDGTHLERAFFSYDLLDSISVLIGNDRELQIMYSNQKTIMSSCLPHTFLDFHNIIGTVSQILQDCRARIMRLRYSNPTQQDPPRLPQTAKQHYAQIYRDSQLKILQNAIAVCAFVVLHASTDLSVDDLLLTMQAKMNQFYSPHIDALARKLPCVTKGFELITIDAIVEMVPDSLRPRLQDCIQDITRAQDQLQSQPTLPTCHSNVMKSGLAIALSAMYCERGNGMRLGPRLDAWLDDLTQWYPPDDQSWAYVPSPGPWEPGDEPPQALIILLSVISSKPEVHANPWLQPKMICWGWNVMEEEGVRVPLEIEHFCNGLVEATAEEGAIGYLIYCKQYSF